MLCAALNTFFSIKIEFLTPNTSVRNQLHKTLFNLRQILCMSYKKNDSKLGVVSKLFL